MIGILKQEEGTLNDISTFGHKSPWNVQGLQG